MTKSRLYQALSRVTDIHPGEEIIALLLFLYFFFITTPLTILKPLRDAVFLEYLKSENLPYAYATAILVGFVVAFHSKLQVKISRRLLIISSLILFISTGILFFFLFYSFPQIRKGLSLALWIWVNILTAVLVTQFWITVNDVFNPREAKRMIGFFVSGGILGGISGGLLTGIISKSNTPYGLLLLSAGFLILCVLIVNLVFFRKKKIPIQSKETKGLSEKVGFRDCFFTVAKDHYLRLLASVVAITAVVSTFIDWQYKHIIERSQSVNTNMASFFGFFSAGILILPFFLQLLFTGKLIKRFGIRITLLFFPLILLLCSLGIAIWPVLIFAIFIKGSDKSLSYSINQSSRELLYIPVFPDIKYKAKIFIDMFLSRFAKSIGAILLLALFGMLSLIGVNFDDPGSTKITVIAVSLLSAFLLLIWIFLNLQVTREYISTVKQNIKLKWGRADRTVDEKLDIDYTKLVFDTLESKNRSSVLYALHVFDLLQQEKLTPELKKIIAQKSDEVKLSALGDLFDAEGAAWVPGIEDELDEENLKTDISDIMSMEAYQQVMNLHAEQVMEKSKEAETEKMELAKVISLMNSDSPLVEKLEDLIYDDSSEVSRYAIESAAKLKKKELIPAIIHKLSNPLTKEDAITGLLKYGEAATDILKKYLEDSEKNLEQRKAIVIILSRLCSQSATDVLTTELDKNREDISTEIIDALDRIHSEKPTIHIKIKIIRQTILYLIKKYYKIFLEYNEQKSGRRSDETKESLKISLGISLMNIFKLLGFTYPYEDIVIAYQNIKTGTKHSVAYAIELLDNTMKKDDRDLILPIIEDIPLHDREKLFCQLLKNFPKK